MTPMPRLLRLWFGLSLPVDRHTYFGHGAGLMALKYVVDVAAVKLVTGKTWLLIDYLNPLLSVRAGRMGAAPEWLWLLMAVFGVSMTLRRLLDARRSPWLCLLFFVPFVNWVLMAWLCVAPSRRHQPLPVEDARTTTRLRAALQGVAAGVGIGAISLALHVLLFKSYNAAVFLGTPFTMGAAAGYLYNRGGEKPRTAALGALTVVIASLATLLFALEGVACLAMALPLSIPLGMLGALVGQAIAKEKRESSPAAAALLLLALPLSAALELQRPPLREVLTSVEIDAPPERVWPHVLGFADIDEPPQWFFRLGIAYPVRARLSGRGVGAVRRCEFSTGAFVEPITIWKEPELPGGRTRLEGRTFYTLAMEPQQYWSFFSDLLIHSIHQRVLDHIRAEVR